jgi:radical SAM superfamily enzyme YgiQ (UPF0313 family)
MKSYHLPKEKYSKETFLFEVKRGGGLEVALVFSNSYSFAISSLGWQWNYFLMNKVANVERFYYEPNFTKYYSMESMKLLQDFPVIAFSVYFEEDIINIVKMLENSGIDPLREKRKRPFIIAGGPGIYMNPLPYSNFIDAVLIGDSENVIENVINDIKKNIKYEKESILESLSKYESLYLPGYKNKAKASKTDISKNPAHSFIISKEGSFKDRLIVELERGCKRGCRFCMAGFAYRPEREVETQIFLDVIERSKYKKIAILGFNIADHYDFENILKYLNSKEYNISFSSLRVDALTDLTLELIKKSQNTLVIAPETSERLRGFINKDFTDDLILEKAKIAFLKGFKKVKLYFMIGLPKENESDIESIARLVKEIESIGFLEVSVTLSIFVPKPFTPLQWYPIRNKEYIKKSFKILRNFKIKVKNVSYESAYFQWRIAVGDEEIGKYLYKSINNLKKNFFRSFVQKFDYLTKTLYNSYDELPWDNIDMGINKNYLIREKERAEKFQFTSKCNIGKCFVCGACKIKTGG